MRTAEFILLSICLQDLSKLEYIDRDLLREEKSVEIYDRLKYLYDTGFKSIELEQLEEYRDILYSDVSIELFNKYLKILKDRQYLDRLRHLINKTNYFGDIFIDIQDLLRRYLISEAEYEDNLYSNYLDTILSKRDLIYTGYRALDIELNGLERSDLVIVAGRPSMGKTTFALSLMNKFKNYKVVFLSLEMSTIQLLHKLVGMLTGINPLRLKSCNLNQVELENVKRAIDTLKTRDYYFYDNVYTITDIYSKLSNLDVDIIILDYLQLLCDSENRNLEISRYTRLLKLLAKEKNAVCILLSQLNRNVENRAIKVPTLADLRDSGSIEQDADVVMFIYRDDYYNKDEEEENDVVSSDIIIAKNRKGKTGKVKLVFDKRDVSFKE